MRICQTCRRRFTGGSGRRECGKDAALALLRVFRAGSFGEDCPDHVTGINILPFFKKLLAWSLSAQVVTWFWLCEVWPV